MERLCSIQYLSDDVIVMTHGEKLKHLHESEKASDDDNLPVMLISHVELVDE